MVNQEDLKQIARVIREADSIAVCSHVNPDGDTVGTGAAMRLALLQMGKRAEWFCQDNLPDDMSFLNGWSACRRPESLTDDEHFDLLLCVDVSDDYRMGTAQRLMQRCSESAQIDHHGTNPRTWTQYSCVDGGASACAVVAYALIRELGVEVTKDMAFALYAGISTDTGNFSYSLQPETFRVVADLLSGPMTPDEAQQLHHHIFEESAVPAVRILQRALSHLTFHANGTITSMYLTRQDFIDCGADEQHASIVVNYGLNIQGVKATVLARDTLSGEKGSGVKLSFRAVKPYDIAEVARAFGGGGHAQAAGATVAEKELPEALAMAEEALAGKFGA